ncbi:MAG: prevent-host-death protein [Planctomycetes bacterium]|nr:prevent-host-death protein [Planctomycetota bacterium]
MNLIDLGRDVRSLTDFKRQTPRFLKDLTNSRRAVMLTVNGQAELAVMSAATFQRVLEAMATLEELRCIQKGLEQGRRGQGLPAAQFFADVRARRGAKRRRA